MANLPANTRRDLAPYRPITLGNGADPAIAILLVEDNAGDVRLLQEFLREVASAHFELIQADRLDEAIACLANNRFDIVLLDLSLPDSQGLDTFLELHRRAPGLPIIVLTGLDDETLAMRAMHEGAQDYLIKGQVDGNLLGRSIRYAIERQRAEEALRDSEARYRSVVLSMQEGIILQQADGTILTCNTSAERILALPVTAILGQTSCDLSWQAVHEDGSPFPCEAYPAMITLQTGQPCSNVVLGIHRPVVASCGHYLLHRHHREKAARSPIPPNSAPREPRYPCGRDCPRPQQHFDPNLRRRSALTAQAPSPR
jgi:DNA-binding response OmpR family regulator